MQQGLANEAVSRSSREQHFAILLVMSSTLAVPASLASVSFIFSRFKMAPGALFIAAPPSAHAKFSHQVVALSCDGRFHRVSLETYFRSGKTDSKLAQVHNSQSFAPLTSCWLLPGGSGPLGAAIAANSSLDISAQCLRVVEPRPAR